MPPSLRFRFVAVLVLTLLHAVVGRAEEVSVELDGLAPSLAAQLRVALAGQLADVATVVWDRADAPYRVRVSRDEALVVELWAADERAERRLPAEDEELAAGEVASVVRAFVIARSERPPTAFAWSVSALYTGNTYARELAWQSGLRAEVGLSYRWLHAGVGYGYHPPVTFARPLATIRVRDHGVYATLGAQRNGARLGVGADLLAGTIGTLRETTATVLTETGDSWDWSPSLGLRLRGRLRVWRGLWIELMPAVEVTLGRPAYEIEGAVDGRMLSPRAVQGRLDVGATL